MSHFIFAPSSPSLCVPLIHPHLRLHLLPCLICMSITFTHWSLTCSSYLSFRIETCASFSVRNIDFGIFPFFIMFAVIHLLLNFTPPLTLYHNIENILFTGFLFLPLPFFYLCIIQISKFSHALFISLSIHLHPCIIRQPLPCLRFPCLLLCLNRGY